MAHALIIDDNMAVGRAIQNRLLAFGFDSFDHTWTRQQAHNAASLRRPDLVVVGDHLADGSPIEIAREVASANEVPILAVTCDRALLQRLLPADAELDGPYPLSELDTALEAALPCV